MVETATETDSMKPWLLQYVKGLNTIAALEYLGQCVAEDKANGVDWSKDAKFMEDLRKEFAVRRGQILATNRANNTPEQTLR